MKRKILTGQFQSLSTCLVAIFIIYLLTFLLHHKHLWLCAFTTRRTPSLCAFCGGNLVRLSSLPRHFLFRTLSRPLYFSATFLLVGQEIVHSQNPQFSLRFGEFSHLLSLSHAHTHTDSFFLSVAGSNHVRLYFMVCICVSV